MGFFFCLGKFILATSLILYGYLILLDPTIKEQFDKNFRNLQVFIPVVSQVFQYLDYIRFGFAITNLLAVFMIFSNTRCIPTILTLELILFSAILNNPILVKDEKAKEETIGRLLKTVAIIGGLIYLNSCFGKCNKEKEGEKVKEE